MTPQDRVLVLLEPLYRAGLDVEAWLQFVEALSGELAGAAIQVTTDAEDWEEPHESYWVGLEPTLGGLYGRHARNGLPWGSRSDSILLGGFCRTSTIVSNKELAGTAFYQEWMRPQGLACEGPLVHVVRDSVRRPGWMMCIYRVEGARAFDRDDISLCNLLAPHLATYTHVFDTVDRVQRERAALSEVIDRILNGVFLVDAKGGLLISNVEARRILATEDGVSLEDGVLRLAGEGADAALHNFLADAIGWKGRDSFGAGGELSVERPSGKRSYIATVVPMNEAGRDSAFGDDVAVVLIADLDADQSVAAARVRRIYELTDAETEILRLLAEGSTLEAISRDRGVSMNTTRTHLKHLFWKTQTNRQSELVRMVLSTTAPPR